MPIRNVVFDLGRVLFDFSMSGVVEFLNAHGARLSGLSDFVRASALLEHEHGRISGDEFIERLRGLCSIAPDREVLTERWVRIFSPIPEMTELARRLRGRFGVWILSNTSELHWRYLENEYRLEEIADGWLTSYKAGAMKPNPKIFEAACRQFDIFPADSVFIDDLEANAEGARACGWTAIQHRSPQETIRELARLGVAI